MNERGNYAVLVLCRFFLRKKSERRSCFRPSLSKNITFISLTYFLERVRNKPKTKTKTKIQQKSTKQKNSAICFTGEGAKRYIRLQRKYLQHCKCLHALSQDDYCTTGLTPIGRCTFYPAPLKYVCCDMKKLKAVG